MQTEKHIINKIHSKMNDYYDKTKERPMFLFVGDYQYDKIELSHGLFCPEEHRHEAHRENKLFGMEVVLVNRENFLQLG